MKSAQRVSVFLFATLLLSGCAAQRLEDQPWYQKTREISAKAVDFTKSTATASYERVQKYLKEKELLKTFHDTGEHSEAAVLDVLHRAGIGSRPAAPAPGPTAPSATQKAPVAKIPEHYAGKYRWPLDAGIISSEYGQRWGKMHKGLDIAADSGEPVYAVAAGQVIYAGDGMRGYGNVVILKHDDTITSLYAHNSQLKVKQGDAVKQGDLIALLGSTGHSTGPHVHFEFRQGDVAVNPHTLLPKSRGAEDVVAARESMLLPSSARMSSK